MSETRTIEIRLPEGHDFSEVELETLRVACEDLAGLSGQGDSEPRDQIQAMTEQGWHVQRNLTWVARAEREREYEEATGDTPCQALCRLCQLVGLHTAEGCP